VSGNAIKAYGTNGTLASGDITRDTRSRRTAAAAEQKQGSSSVILGFTRCD
jgi:hypothetical protein